MAKRFWGLAERWLTRKIGVELRCCLSFFLILFYYSAFRLLCGVKEASILHMAQMMLLAYLVGWAQSLLKADFDEIDGFDAKETAVLILGPAVYALAGWLWGWFGENQLATVLFFAYMIGCGLSTFLLCRVKRSIDAKLLNDDLKAFKNRDGEDCFESD